MASNITTNATYVTTNMKPVPDEQVDALWGQNVGDFLGHLLYREIPIPADAGDPEPSGGRYARFQFTKRASHNGLKLLFRGQPGTTGNVTTWSRVYPNGGTTSGGAGASIVATHSITMTQYQAQRLDLDISALSTGSVYTYEYEYGQVMTPIPLSCYQIHGTGATY